jgi:cell division protein FtsI/penicillin-binding protein 2
MRSTRRYPSDAINRLNMAVASAPLEDDQPVVVHDYIALPGRLTSLKVLFILLGLLLLGQLFRLQISRTFDDFVPPKPDLTQHLFFPPRGEIYDRWGRLLAGNTLLYEVGANMAGVDNPVTIANAMAKVMSDNSLYNNPQYPSSDYEADILANIDFAYAHGISYVLLADFVTAEQLLELNGWVKTYSEMDEVIDEYGRPVNLNGLVYRERLDRSYPEGFLVEQILGFVDNKGQGFYGVEARYNELLAGDSVIMRFSGDPDEASEIPYMEPGDDLVLTFDREMQAAVYDILEEALDETGSKSGTVVVMDPNTGEILAMVSLPQVELQPYWEEPEGEPTPFNRSISTDYEPGSVFKVLTMAAALDCGAVTPETTFTDTGSIEIGGILIINWDRGAWGEQDMQGCMQHSLNVCLTWVAMQTGVERFYSYMQAFGFGRLTGVDLAGETAGRLKLPGDSDWYEADLGTNSFGQGIAVTPVQMLMAISAVANGRGEMMMPHVMLSTVRGGAQYTPVSQVVGRPISADTAQTLTEMLANSLENESSVAMVEGYRVAGKTGTAQVAVNGVYSDSITNASFVGWGPVDEPRFLIYVWLEHPETSPWGSVVAAPVFSQVFSRLAILANLPPDDVRMSMSNP